MFFPISDTREPNLVFFAFVLANSTIPTYDEFCQTYIFTYTCKTYHQDTPELYTSKGPTHYAIGRIIDSEQFQFENQLIKFNALGLKYTSGLPKNEFTLFDLMTRIYKVFGSLIRDFENSVIIWTEGVDTYYSYRNDMSGIDLQVNDKLVRSFTSGFGGGIFAYIKVNARHPNLDSKYSIKIKADVMNAPKDELVRTSPRAVKEIRRIATGGKLTKDVTVIANDVKRAISKS